MSFFDSLFGTPKSPSQLSAEEMKTFLFKAVRTKAEEGDAKAQLQLVHMYQDGSGVPKDERMALEWGMRAAAQGEVVAQNFIANAYERGLGCSQDFREAVRWHLAASLTATPSEKADAGYLSTMALGFIYANGSGPSEHVRDVLERLQRFDNILMHWCTGFIWARGHGVPKNLIFAASSLLRVVEIDTEATSTLKVILVYNDNYDQPVDLEQTRSWLEWAASQNIAHAQLAMAFIHLYGWRGATSSKEESLAWLARSASSGSDRAKALLAAARNIQ